MATVGEPDRDDHDLEAEWGNRARAEPRWPASIAVAGAIGLQLVLPGRLVLALINMANLVSLGYLVNALVATHPAGGKELIYSGAPVWITNIIVFALWYWELDRGGPSARIGAHRAPDFLFPQMTARGVAIGDWSPGFLDYLYTSFTNVTAFSPTDTMPLSPWAKVLMMM